MTQNIDAAPDSGAPSWPGANASQGEPFKWRWLALGVILLATAMDILDSLITTIAAPSIVADIGGGATFIQWLGAGYTLAMACGLIIGGRLGDIFGKKNMFVVGAVGFTFASLLCSVATSPGILVTARLLQGLFGAMMLPQGLGIITEVFPPKEMGKAFGAYGPILGLATVGGPILGGWLINLDLFGTGWRMIFLINLPLGAIAIYGAIKWFPKATKTAKKLDVVGALLASLGAALLVFPVVQGREEGWPAWTFVSIVAGVLTFFVFGWWEGRRQKNGGEPLVVPSLFKKKAFNGGLVAGLALFSALTGFSLVLSVYLQLGLGFSALGASLAVLPQAIGSTFGFAASGAGLAAKLGRRLIHIGLVGMILGLVAFYFTITLAGTGVSGWAMAPSLFFAGIGMGLAMAPFFELILAGVDPHETGSASGTLTSVQQFGGALGVAILGTVFFAVVGGSGYLPAIETSIWVVVALEAAAAGLIFFLPKMPKPAWDPSQWEGGEGGEWSAEAAAQWGGADNAAAAEWTANADADTKK
jgi:EmrB/QacA subfamily drug resistance transporter